MGKERKTFLLVPAGGRGEGMGHLMRCLKLARDLRGSCAIYTGYLDVSARKFLSDFLERMPGKREIMLKEKLRARDRWDIVLLDKRKTSAREYAGLSRHGRVFCLDEGGEARGIAAYLIDTLPRPKEWEPANVSSIGFLDLPSGKRKKLFSRFRKVLFSFGGEDSGDLSGILLDAVIRAGLVPAGALTVVEGPFFKRREWPFGVTVLRGITRLVDVLPGYDLLFTHFGMAALEALAIGIPVALFNPSAYHRKLGRILGIPDIGVRRPDLHALRALIRDPFPLREAVDRFGVELKRLRGMTLVEHLRGLTPGRGGGCRACGSVNAKAIGRFPRRTFFRCAACGIIFQDSFAPDTRSYGKRYFFQEYRKQYGRTYLSDFESIKKTGMQRIARMRALLKDGSDATIVDLGCAYGPFLAALRQSGFRPFGVDISADAVRYVRGKLGIPAIRCGFETLKRKSLPPGRIRGVTLWYVLEHFTDLDGALRKAASLLAPGGVFAFSTPNSRGISAKKNLREYLENSPMDHYTILSPREVPGLLKHYGFTLKAVYVTGHHPERFPGVLGRAAAGSAPARWLLETISRVFGLGDTFEAYAVKENGQ